MADDKKKQEPIVESEWVEPIVESEWSEPIVESEWSEPTSPKSPAPSTKGGESGALVRPLTPTSASEGSELESWTQTINPFADKGAVKPTQQAQQAGVAKKLNQVESGNIDLSNRPVVDYGGKKATVLSFSIGTDKGEVLIPQVVNGKVVSKDEAIKHYEKTGEHLGIFKTIEDANRYGQELHQQEEKRVASLTKKDKGVVKPTQQAGATQAPKAKLLKVIPSSEKKSPELLKARVDTYGDMYKRAMDRAYTLKQSVEGVDNELKNSKAYVDSNPNDQNAINSYNALISKRNEMAEMARMEIARADVWQKGIEKTQLEIDDSLTASESISNSISNMATQIKGFLPASGLAISTLENKIQQGVLYVAGKLMGADDETASKVSVLASQNLPSAGILGTTQKEASQFYTERLGELEKEQKPTKSIIKTFEEGDVAGLGAAILDGGSSVLSSVITSAPTGGVGIFTEMMGRSVYDFNNEKAKRLKISVDELYDRGLDEAAVPLAIGAVSASLEKIGLDGISKAINKKIGSKAVKDIFEIVLEGSIEAGTEWLQTGAEEYNKAIASGMNAEQAGEVALSKMLSEEGREAALKGAAGSGVSIATGRAAKSLYGMAKSNRDKLYQDLAKVETLARERANPNLSSEALSSIDREINNTTANMQKEVLDQLNRRANLTEENASLVEGIEANVKTISDDIESKKLLSEDPSLSDDAKIIIDLEIADLEANRLDLAAQSEEIIKNNRPIELKKNTSPTSDKYGTINRNDGKGVVDLTKEEYEAEQAKMQPKVDEQVAPTAEQPKTEEEKPLATQEVMSNEKLLANLPSESEASGVFEDRGTLKNAPVTITVIDRYGNKNRETRYIPWSIHEKANKNDTLGGQTAREIAQRGGYSDSELDGKYPNWRKELAELSTPTAEGEQAPKTKEEIDAEIERLNKEKEDEIREVKRTRGLIAQQTLIPEIEAKYNTQITELEKQYEKEPTKKEDGEPMSGGVQGVRPEGQAGKESAELRPEEKEVADPLKDVESTTAALGNAYYEQQKYDEYYEIKKIAGLEDSTVITDISKAYHKAKADGSNPQLVEAVEQLLGKPKEVTPQAGSVVGGEVENRKNKQLEIINKENPAPNNYNTWVRSVEDIKTADEVFEVAKNEGAIYPDFTEQDMEDALSKGDVVVYSSYPIKNGVFVSPSKMNAQDYAGGKGGKIYSKVVKLEDVAWIDEGQGQYAKVEQSLQSTPQEEEKISGGLTQEEKANLENISKDAGVNFQEVRNVYNKYGEGKPLNEITLEDYQKAEEKRQELLTPKQEEDAKKQQSGQMREQGVQDQPQRKGDSDMPIINEAELQDGEAVEEEVTQEELNKQQDKETQVLLNGEAAKRRSAGKFIKDGVEYVRNKVDKGIRGIKGSVKFAEGVPNMPFTYKLVEAETLQPSHSQGVRNQMHFIPEAQPKRRNDEGSVAAEIGFANNPRFNELGENTNAYSGAPIVNERNEVVQGNNRSAGLKIGYDRGNKKYKNDLADNAEKFGFTREQVEGMKNPILVREVAFSDEGAIEYGNYDAKDLETGGKRRIDPLALVKRIPLKEKARLAKLLFSGEGTLNSNIRANSKDVLAILNPFLNQAQRTTLLKDGEITSSGVEDIEALVQQFLFDNGDMALPELFENLPYRQREGIRKSLPFIFSAGVEADVIPEIQNAILALNQFQSTGIENFDTWLNQSDVFADNKTPRDIYTPQELAIARALNEAKTQSEIVEKFKSFSSAVQGTPEIPANLIDEAKPAIEGQSKEEALKQIFNVKENESRQKENLRGGKKVDKQQEAPKQKPKEPTAEEVEEEGLPKLTKEQQIEAERRSLNEPKNVSDLAKIFNKILGLSPKESVMAARLFDVKAKNMSELLGITKDEYYQRYWFTGEQEGGLSQMTLPDGREVTVKRMSPEVVNGFYSPIEKNLMEYGKDKIKAKDWLNVVGKGDEAVFTGVRAFLEGKDPNAMVSKQEILDYMKDNRISIVEVVRKEQQEGINGFINYVKSKYGNKYSNAEIQEQWDTGSGFLYAEYDNTFDETGNAPKYSQYQLEGEKENYKEVLVTLPSSQLKSINEYNDARDELDAFERSINIPTEEDRLRYSELSEKVKELQDRLPKNAFIQQGRAYIGKQPFRSTHFDELDILVHLRMNTRTDADGNKVLFLEEVQSDWGQLGKKEGFELSKEEKQKLIEEHKGVLAQLQDIDAKIIANVESGNKDRSAYDLAQQKIKLQEKSEELKDKIFKTKPPTAPFVMDTNAWTKLGLKVALKEAVAQGVDKIAWTTGEQQNDRYDLSKTIEQVAVIGKNENDGKSKRVTLIPKDGETINMNVSDEGLILTGDYKNNKLEDVIGKELSEKVLKSNDNQKTRFEGNDLKVGGKGMKGFYGSMEEGKKGIVGGVAEKVYGQKVGTVEIQSENFDTKKIQYLADKYDVPTFMISKVVREGDLEGQAEIGLTKDEVKVVEMFLRGSTTQPSIDITPELKAQVQEGLPLFQERRGAWSKIAASAKRIISMYDKARLDTAVHEILGHDFLDEIISLSATNKEFEQDLNTIIDEYIKSSGNKTSKATLLNELKNFNVESNNQSVNARAIHEWFSRTAEGYFMGETNIKPDSKLAKMFEQFRQYLTDLFNTMTSRNYIIPSEPMKQIFRKAFGAENFDFVNDYAEANIMEGKLDVLRITENEIPQSRLDKFKKLREAKRGLGQEEDVDIDELVDAARYLSTDPTVNVFSVVDELVSMYPQKEEYIRKHSKTFEKVFEVEGKKVSETARSVYESEVVSPEMKQRAATIEDLFLYSPEKLQEKMEDVESLIANYSIDDLMAFFATSNEIPFKEYPLFLAAMQKRISRAINELNNSNQGQSAAKQKLLNYEMTIMDRYIAEGTATGQRLNYFKVLKNMSTDGKLRFFKRKFKEESGNAVKEFQDLISNLRKERDKAYKDNDYFLEENLSLEQRIEDLEAELAKERSTKARNDKRKDRESSTSNYKNPPKRKISQSELNEILKNLSSAGLGQSFEDLNDALKLGFYIIQDKKKTIEQFTRDWNKITKQNKTQEELSQVYRDVRKYATENEGVDIDDFDSDAMIQSSIDSFNERASQKKNLAKKELDSDIAKAEKEAMKTQMSEKDKEVKAKEALKKREKEIRDNFLDSLSQDGLWQQYVKSVSGRILGNLGSKLGAKQSEKALLDEFTQLATKELNKAIDELMLKQKGGKAATPNYAQQLGDLIANQEKLADIFDKAVKDFAEKNKGNANAQSILSKLNGLKNPFSEKLMENALEKEAQNYAIKIGDLAFKYAGLRQNLKDQIVAQIVAETGLTGQQAAQLEQDLRAKFDNIIAETEQDTAGQLAKAILSNAKKELGLGKKQQDYVKELLGYLKNKAKDYYKTTNKQALVDPFEQLKYAVEMLNDANGRKIWDDSKAELIAKIDSDKDLSQQEKDDLKAYLDDYQNAIFDQLLSKNKLFNNVKKVLAEESPFVKKDGSVDWNGIIIQAKGNVEIAKQIILDSVADKLQGYSGSQVNSVIDAIGREYQRRINEKRAEIIEKQLKDISDKKVIFKKKIATGFVQKLVEMENSGALGDQRFEQALKEWIGFSDMTPDKWSRLRELIVDAEEAPEGNERDRAIENLSAYIKFNKIGKFAEIYASAYYAGLLARPTTIIKNSTGIIEPLLTLFYKSFTDRNYAKAMLQGLKRGDAADIWGGGLVQGGKLDEEVGNDGLPRVNMLKQWRMQQKGIIPKLFALGARPLDLLSMADALSQAMVERGAEYEFYARYLLEKNKEDIRNGVQGVTPITEKEARRIAIKRLSDDAMLDWAFAQAEDEFASRKIVPSSARLNRRAYEIVSESLLPTSVRELAQNLALEESYKSKLISFRGMTAQTRAQKRLETNYGVATFLGSFAKGLVDLLGEGGGYVAGATTKVLPVTEARRNQIRNSVERAISMRVLPFARGISNVVEKGLEKTPYGIVSGVIGATAEKLSYGKPKTIDEILQHQYMMNRNKAKIAKSATSMIIGSAIYYTLLSASKEWDDEEEKEERYYLPTGFYSAGETVRFGKNKIERYTLPVNCVVLYGRIIPLSLFGTVGIGSMITAQAYDNFLSKEKKKQGAVVDPDNPESIKGFSSFVSSSGNAILNMSAMQSISELQESVSSKGTMDFGDYASKLSVKSIALPIPFSGTANQIIQGARYLSGDKTAQAAIGADEKIYKELGLAGIVYNRPVLDWRGRPVNAVLQNQEGIASFVSMLDKRPLDKIDMYLLKELEFNPVIDKRLSDNFADLNMVGMSKDEYYDYTKNVGMTANNYIEAYFDKIKDYQIPQDKIDELAAEGKKEADLKKQLKTIKKTFVSDFLNIAEQKHMLNYQFKKGIINEAYEAKVRANNDRLKNLIEKINDKGE